MGMHSEIKADEEDEISRDEIRKMIFRIRDKKAVESRWDVWK